MVQSNRLPLRVQFGIVAFRRFAVFRRVLTAPEVEGNGSKASKADSEGYKRRPLFVGASEIANLIGANPHVSVGEAVERLWEKNNRRTFSEALARNKLRSVAQEERLKELGVLEMAVAVVETEDVNEYRQRLRKTLQRTTASQDKSVVRDYINTSRGIKYEKTIFESLQRQDSSVKLETDAKRYQRMIGIPNSALRYRITGYIDGVETNSKRIIEIKNRQSRLFNHVPLYEQVQCQAYLFLTELEVCEHTESFQRALQTTTLRWEPVFWKTVVERLNRVILVVDHLLKDVIVQDLFLQSGDIFSSTRGKLDDRKVGARSLNFKSSLYGIENAVDIEAEDSKKLGK